MDQYSPEQTHGKILNYRMKDDITVLLSGNINYDLSRKSHEYRLALLTS